MNREELRNWVLNNCFTKDGNKLSSWKKKQTEEILKECHGKDYTEKVYCLLNKIVDDIKCECGNILEFRGFTYGYAIYCSRRCAGVFTAEKVSLKMKKNFSDLHNKKNILSKTKKTKLERYGDENYRNDEKIKKTCLEKYGVDNPRKSPEITAKILQTKIKNSPFSTYIQTHLPETTIECLLNEEWFKDAITEIGTYQLSKVLDCSYQTIVNFCKRYDINLNSKSVSFEEEEVFNFIKSIYSGKIERNKRDVIHPYEIDLYLPELKFAIEYNGLYWHSFNFVEDMEQRNYHKKKSEMCKKKGIFLYTLFSNEWQQNTQAVRSFLKNKLQKNKIKIGARQTKIIKPFLSEVKKFYNNNHLQGYTKSCYKNYALTYKDEIVSMMSFSKSRFNNNFDWELIRFAVLNEHNIIGAASKLLNTFMKENVGSIISYSDNRYSEGNLYKTLGFDHIGDINPQYYYVRGNKIFNRMNFQKKKLAKIKDFDFNTNLTEAENMFNNGYRRIWDCGKIAWSIQQT